MSDPGAFTNERETEEQQHAPEPFLGEEEAPPSGKQEKARGLWSDAWYDLRRKPLFWVSITLIVIFMLMALFPSLFTSTDPYAFDLSKRTDGPESGHIFGYDLQGRDVYARSVYGAQVSILVGLVAALGVGLVGGAAGIIAGYYGGWIDAVLSRIGDVFFGLPFVLGAIVLLSTFIDPTKSGDPTKIKVVVILAIVVLSWPQFARVMRSSVIATKQSDYVQAARALGAGHTRIMVRHILPNAISPLIVMTTIALGVFVGVEATLSFLGVGLRPPIISWGIAISDAQTYLDIAPHMLLVPAAFLSAAVLGFVMLGEAVREAIDPKLK
ncbi:MAG: ABC transporter permease [Corynebacteriales bacterium]|nr:ABC transporter permease [Mycobacteriales bacterium]